MAQLRTLKGIARPRKSLPLTGTHAKAAANLCAHSHAALRYAQAALRAAGGLTVPASGVVRRALLAYVQRLQEPSQALEEFSAVRQVCKVIPCTPEALHKLRRALEQAEKDAEQGTAPPPFAEVLGREPMSQALQAATEALLSHTPRTKATDCKAGPKSA